MRDWTDWSFKQKLGFTLLMLFIYRVGVAIPLPFVDPTAFEEALSEGFASNFVAAITMVGGSLTQLGLFSLGVMPYITASIIFQLLKVALPRIKEMTENPVEQKRITQWTRYLTVFIAFTQSIGIILGAPMLLGVQVFTSTSILARVLTIFTMIVGAVIVMRIGEEITMRGVSNGMSLVIATSILSSMPALVYESFLGEKVFGVVGFSIILLGVLAIVSYVEKSEYRIPVIYPKTQYSVTGKSNLPVKVAIAGVLPVIFSSVFISVPQMLTGFIKAEWVSIIATTLTPGNWVYTILFILITVGMTYFSVQMVFDVDMISRQINEQGGFVVGKRPGKETKEFIKYIAYKMAGLDAVYLVVISLITLYLFPLVGVPEGAFGATSIIILSTVTVTLLATIDTETATKNLKKHSLFKT